MISYGKENKDDETSKAIHRARRGRAGCGGRGKDMEAEEMGEGRGSQMESKPLPQKLGNIRGRKGSCFDSDSKRSICARKTATKETNYEVEVFTRMKYENNFCLI